MSVHSYREIRRKTLWGGRRYLEVVFRVFAPYVPVTSDCLTKEDVLSEVIMEVIPHEFEGLKKYGVEEVLGFQVRGTQVTEEPEPGRQYLDIEVEIYEWFYSMDRRRREKVSVSFGCKCPERKKKVEDRNWKVWEYKCNHSAFNGYRRTNSDYSLVKCNNCGAFGRTKAKYVEKLRHGKDG